MYFFSIKDNYINICSNIIGGSNKNLKIIGIPKPDNIIKLEDRSILKVKDVYWQVKIDDKWINQETGYEYKVNRDYIGKELRVLIAYFDEDGFLNNICIPYFNISINNTYNLPVAEENKSYEFSFSLEKDEIISLDSDWLKFKLYDNIVTLYGIPKYTNSVNFYVKKKTEIVRSYIVNVSKKIQNENDNRINQKIIVNEGSTEIMVDNLYVFNLKTKNVSKKINFNVENLPRWLNFIDNKDGSALISGIPNIDNVGENNISLTVFYDNYYDKLDYSVKVIPDKTLPILKEISSLPKATNAKNIYYYFSSSKNGHIIYDGNIKSTVKSANVGYNKILLQTNVDGIYSGSIRVKDSNRNVSKPLTIKSFKIDRSKPTLLNVHIESDGKNSNYAKLNDTIKLKITANKEINKPSVIILNRYADVKEISKVEYEATYTVGTSTLSEMASFKINFADYLKTRGEEVTQVTDDSFVKIDMTKPKLNSVKILSSNENKIYGIIDDIISLEVESNEPINTPSMKIFGENISIVKINDSHFIGRYIIKETTNQVNNLLNIEFEDFAGNKGNVVTETTDDSLIQINTKKIKLEEVKSINFTTNSEIEYEIESDDNGVIIGFNRIKSSILSIVKGNNILKFDKLENGTYNNAKIFVKNDIGNVTEYQISEFVVNSEEINPDFENVILKSNGNNNDLCPNDVVTLYFKTNKIVSYPVVLFQSGENDVKNNVIIKKLSDLEWTAEYIIHENDSYGSISFNLEIFDKYNLNKIATTTTDTSYLLYNKESISYIKQQLNSISERIDDIREDVFDCFFKTEVLNNRLDTVEEFELIKKLNSITKDNKVIGLVGDEVTVLSNKDDDLSKIKYQWQRKGPTDELWENIENENDLSYLIQDIDVNYNLRTKVVFFEGDKEQMMFPNNIYVLNKNDQIWNFLQA